MAAVRFYTLPTLVGWFVAYVTCVALHFGSHLIFFGAPAAVGPALRVYATALMFGGVFIVLPTYLLVILPLSLVDVTRARRGASEPWVLRHGAVSGGRNYDSDLRGSADDGYWLGQLQVEPSDSLLLSVHPLLIRCRGNR